MFERILITAGRARSRCTAVHPAALFAGNRWRPAGLTRARLRPAAKAIKHWAAGIEFIDENGGGPGVRLRKRRRFKTPK